MLLKFSGYVEHDTRNKRLGSFTPAWHVSRFIYLLAEAEVCALEVILLTNQTIFLNIKPHDESILVTENGQL